MNACTRNRVIGRRAHRSFFNLKFNTMKKKHLFQGLLLAMFFSSCLKFDWTEPESRTTTINGKIQSYYNAPLAFEGPIPIQIVDHLPTGGFSGGAGEVILADTLYPPYDFSYQLDRADRVAHYYVIIAGEVPRYLTPGVDQYYDESRCMAGSTNDITIRLKTSSWVRIHAQNLYPPFDDTLRIPKLIGNGFLTVYDDPEVILYDKGWGGGRVDFEYSVHSQTGEVRYPATYHLVAHDTIDFSITY